MIWHIGPAAHAVTAVVDAPCVLEGVKLGADNSKVEMHMHALRGIYDGLTIITSSM
jgi:hypothetical protein